MYIKIYQCNPERDYNELAFCNYEFAIAHGGIDPANYDTAVSTQTGSNHSWLLQSHKNAVRPHS